MDRIEKIISKVNGSMAIEGMPLSEIDKNNIRHCLTGKMSFDDMVRSLVIEYKRSEEDTLPKSFSQK